MTAFERFLTISSLVVALVSLVIPLYVSLAVKRSEQKASVIHILSGLLHRLTNRS
jgi:hypothetical protein